MILIFVIPISNQLVKAFVMFLSLSSSASSSARLLQLGSAREQQERGSWIDASSRVDGHLEHLGPRFGTGRAWLERGAAERDDEVGAAIRPVAAVPAISVQPVPAAEVEKLAATET
jgi:hypothetical protein